MRGVSGGGFRDDIRMSMIVHVLVSGDFGRECVVGEDCVNFFGVSSLACPRRYTLYKGCWDTEMPAKEIKISLLTWHGYVRTMLAWSVTFYGIVAC